MWKEYIYRKSSPKRAAWIRKETAECGKTHRPIPGILVPFPETRATDTMEDKLSLYAQGNGQMDFLTVINAIDVHRVAIVCVF